MKFQKHVSALCMFHQNMSLVPLWDLLFNFHKEIFPQKQTKKKTMHILLQNLSLKAKTEL